MALESILYDNKLKFLIPFSTSLGAPEECLDRLGSLGESTERGVPGKGNLVGSFCGRAWVRSGADCYNGRQCVTKYIYYFSRITMQKTLL